MSDAHQSDEHGHEDGGHVDEWFRHGANEPDAQESHGEVNPTFIIGFLAVVIVITFSVVGVILVYFGGARDDQFQTKRMEATDQYLAQERRVAESRWRDDLRRAQPEWQDVEQGLVSVSLDRAKEAVIEMYGDGGGGE